MTRSNKPAPYWEATQWPLQCLYFLLPLLVVYEIGTILVAHWAESSSQRILAERLLRNFFDLFGIAGVHLPAITIVVVLICWHIARPKDPAKPQGRLQMGMLAESLVLAVPLFVLQLLTLRVIHGQGELAMMATDGELSAVQAWASKLVLSIGAGLYEELVFRLLAITVLMIVFEEVLAIPRKWAALTALVCSSLAFSWYHFWGGEVRPAAMVSAIFFALAGAYFAGIFMLRGFGIVVGTHAAADVLIVSAPRLADWMHNQ